MQEQLGTHPELFRRLGLLIEQLGARGRTSVAKGCRGRNRGWLRAPLGGAGGCQYYLWWTTAGSEPGRRCELPADAIAIRTARHHDEMSELDPRSRGDYLEVAQAADIDEQVAGRPWTEAQARFREATAAVRVVEGRPGSGKTTALWHSVDAREDAHVLYVTWSSALAEDAQSHFDSFAAPNVKTTCTDYATLLAELTGEPVRRLPLRESMRLFAGRLKETDGSQAGAWAREPRATYAEMRGMLLGGATDAAAKDTRLQDGCLRLTDDGCRRRRARSGRIDDRSMRALVRTAERLPAGTFAEAFPELAAAHNALERLADGGAVPAKWRDVDRIVVDETQDLTLTETAVITRLCRRIGESSGRMPRLLVAGDEGQTVRPSGFAWARTRELLDREVGRPATYTLDVQVRCPVRIEETCEIVDGFYKQIDKRTRLRRQHNTASTGAGEGEVLRVRIQQSEYEEVIERLAAMPATAVVSATADVPEWIPERLRHQVLTPAEAKGLEYQTVCVVELDGGCALATVGTIAHADPRLNEEMRRNAIDQARVALTRATDTLVLLDDEASWTMTPMKEKAIGYSAADLIEHLADDASTPEERAVALAEECRRLREENVDRALVRGRQALVLLGRGDDMGKVTDPATCRLVADSVLSSLAAGLLDEDWDEEKRNGATAMGQAAIVRKSPPTDEHGEAIYDPDDDEEAKTVKDEATARARVDSELLRGLAHMQGKSLTAGTRVADLVALLRGPDGTERTWADSAIARHRARFAREIEAGADTIAAIEYRKPVVELRLRAIGVEDAEQEAERLARKAFDGMTNPRLPRGAEERSDRLLNAAEAVLATLPEDPLREAVIEEAELRWTEALKLFRKAGSVEDVERVITENALWEEAEGTLDETGQADRRWLLALERLGKAIPKGITQRMSRADAARLLDGSAEKTFSQADQTAAQEERDGEAVAPHTNPTSPRAMREQSGGACRRRRHHHDEMPGLQRRRAGARCLGTRARQPPVRRLPRKRRGRLLEDGGGIVAGREVERNRLRDHARRSHPPGAARAVGERRPDKAANAATRSSGRGTTAGEKRQETQRWKRDHAPKTPSPTRRQHRESAPVSTGSRREECSRW